MKHNIINNKKNSKKIFLLIIRLLFPLFSVLDPETLKRHKTELKKGESKENCKVFNIF